jgi:DNA polymerase III sliding clamp (beta) subunit (PCNA family)
VAERKVKTLPVDEFPSIPQIQGKSIPLPDALRTSIHDAMECASTDQTRLLLNSTFIDVSKKGAHYVVATDGRCLFSSNSFNLPLKESLIIPTNKFIGWKEFNNDGEWQLTVGTPQHKDEAAPFQISSRRWSFISRQIEGSYPNWRQVVPTEFRTTVEFHADAVAEIIQTIERMPEHDQVNNTLGIEVKGQQLNLLCKASADQPWIAVEILKTKINGPNVTVYLNRQLVIRALQFGLMRLDLIDALSAVKFSHEGRQMVVMVLRPDGPPRTWVTAPNTPAKDEPEPEKPETSQPAAQLPAAQPERNTMPKSSGTNGHEPAADKPALEKAVEQIETIKASVKSAVGGLNELLDTLKQVQREHKTSEREVQSVRSTLEKLQSVKL